MFSSKKDKLEKLNQFLLEIVNLIMQSGNYKIHKLDFYVLSIINRTIALNKAFITLIDNKNSLTAISIVRLQLDNAIRLNIINIVDNVTEFLDHFFDGKPINRFRVNENRLTDRYLVEELNKDVDGATKLYEYLCDFVHFSDKHFEATKTKPKNKEAMFRIQVGNSDVLNKKEEGYFYDSMINISNTIARISKEWSSSKDVLLK